MLFFSTQLFFFFTQSDAKKKQKRSIVISVLRCLETISRMYLDSTVDYVDLSGCPWWKTNKTILKWLESLL